jgi:hypothetical protein
MGPHLVHVCTPATGPVTSSPGAFISAAIDRQETSPSVAVPVPNATAIGLEMLDQH